MSPKSLSNKKVKPKLDRVDFTVPNLKQSLRKKTKKQFEQTNKIIDMIRGINTSKVRSNNNSIQYTERSKKNRPTSFYQDSL